MKFNSFELKNSANEKLGISCKNTRKNNKIVRKTHNNKNNRVTVYRFFSSKKAIIASAMSVIAVALFAVSAAYASGSFDTSTNIFAVDHELSVSENTNQSLTIDDSYENIKNPVTILSGGSNAVATDDLVCDYDFVMQNEGSTEIPDASGHTYAGELKGLNSEQVHKITNPSIFGKTKKACKVYGGVNGTYLEIPKAAFSSMVTTNQMTVSAWVNLDENLDYARIFDFGTGTDNYFYVLDSGRNQGFEGLASAVKLSGIGSTEKGVGKGESLLTGA